MLDYFTILTTGGIVLFHLDLIPAPHNPIQSNDQSIRLGDSKKLNPTYQSSINQLILQIFNSGKIGLKSWTFNGLKLEWILENELNLIFVAVYQNILQLTYVEELLKVVKQVFIQQYGKQVEQFLSPTLLQQFDNSSLNQFEPNFRKLLKSLEFQNSKQSKQPRKFEQTKKFQESLKGGNSEKMQLKQGSNGGGSGTDTGNDGEGESAEDLAQRFKFTQGKKAPRKFQPKNKGNKGDDDANGKKSARSWDDGKVSKKQMELLDYSDDKHLSNQVSPGNGESDGDYEDHSDKYQLNQGLYDLQEFSSVKVATPQKSAFTNIFNTLTGQKELNNENLAPIIKQLQEHLVQKNVASEIAKQVCESVQSNLVGTKLGAFQSINTVCKNALQDSLTRILSPGTSLDLLKDIQRANKQEQRPYVITFIGVNGVGKSTNLSKVCFWLLQNKKKVLIAACDTFRSGAVEQLRVHATNLLKVHQSGQVALFERGYGKDSATIARDAIKYAKENGFDVVMVDTAGRMQNNEPLMKSLAKLVTLNQPDKVLFVGEALVGNEAVDQLKGFNQALANFSGSYQPREIDGIILTKFDTIDDKVGAALSMTYTSGAPILFVGTGQTYTDLKRMSVEIIVNTLLN